MGLVGTAHPDGEFVFARASTWCGIPYCVSTAISKLYEKIMQCFISEQKSVAANSNSAIPPANLFFQLYVHSRVDVTVKSSAPDPSARLRWTLHHSRYPRHRQTHGRP
ncbi:hypothetical protein QBC33DRAFT_549929 [Phialemonium atrogriseum]|uniref:FMN-dependent dehydrogenase domain-containing protein n=1 Tax=Phialemonium atrogriseum TaxID=1093897 RepID=A0AAJ0BRU2_9PEZI|nr:uncharacterized protein QBC33DRAFT_549929 [Phialemonium atrogriseum]KAK1763328.1 hypothetical protein QBC33DRAFT_549929 [Phialemonium atrogriseum]